MRTEAAPVPENGAVRATPLEIMTALLRDEALARGLLVGCDVDALRDAAIEHDVLPLIAEAALRIPGISGRLRAMLSEVAHSAVVVDLSREFELVRTIRALARAGLTPIVIKGSHLAYTHYVRPDLRSRVDSDLLIPTAARDAAHEVLTGTLGYEASAKVSGALSATQRTYTKAGSGAHLHSLDVHWRLASPQVFAHVLSYEELMATAVPLPRLGPGARGPSNVHALLIACIHRVAHHDDAEELKWFVDIHLIASRLTADEWEAFVALAAARRVGTISRHGLERTIELLGTKIPAAVLNDVRLQDRASESSTAAYLTTRTQAQMVAADLRALGSWRDRVRLLREHLLPSAHYMRTLYAPASRVPLALLYAVRIVRGARTWLFARR